MSATVMATPPRPACIVEPEVTDPVPHDRDVRFVRRLLEEHPLQGAGTRERVRGQEPRALGQVPQDGVRLGERAVGAELEHRDASVGVHGKEPGCPRAAVHDVDLDVLAGRTEVCEQQPNLLVVA